jgi:protein required for attachment to host cells
MNRTWILVADSARARLFSLDEDDDDKEWIMTQAFSNPAGAAKGTELMADRPGRSHHAASQNHRSGMEPHTRPRDVEERHFAHSLARVVDKGVATGTCGRIVLVAPPHFLGLLREELGDQATKRVVTTLSKDFTSMSTQELVSRVEIDEEAPATERRRPERRRASA